MVKAKLTVKRGDNNTETTIVDEANLTHDIPISLQKEVDASSITWFSGTLKGGTAPSPQPNQPPVIEVPATATGKVNVQMDLIARVRDVDGTVDDVNWKQKTGIAIRFEQIDEAGVYTARFTPSQSGVFDFEVEAFDNKNLRSFKTVKVTVEADVPIPPPSGNIIFSSRRDTNLHDGNSRIITETGNIAAGMLGVQCRASGSPKMVVNSDKTFSLKSGSGGIENMSLKVRSRHNEGGDCNNRFGGFGCHIDKTEIGMKTESCHNNHENSLKKSHGASIFDSKFHKLEFTCRNSGTAVEFIASLDGVQKMTGKHNSPKSYYMDKALAEKNSYFWVRLNNADHGRIYVFAKNYNSKLTVVFKMEPSTNSIRFDDIILEAL